MTSFYLANVLIVGRQINATTITLNFNKHTGNVRSMWSYAVLPVSSQVPTFRAWSINQLRDGKVGLGISCRLCLNLMHLRSKSAVNSA